MALRKGRKISGYIRDDAVGAKLLIAGNVDNRRKQKLAKGCVVGSGGSSLKSKPITDYGLVLKKFALKNAHQNVYVVRDQKLKLLNESSFDVG